MIIVVHLLNQTAYKEVDTKHRDHEKEISKPDASD